MKEALVQRIRFEMFWWGREDNYRQGETLPLHVASDGRRFVARVDDFEVLPDGRVEVAFFKGVQGEERTWISQSSGTPAERSSELYPDDWWARFDPALKHVKIVHDTLTVPTYGVPTITDGSATKQRMRDLILTSMQEQLSWDVAHLGVHLPSSVRLVVADFNVEDETAFVLVEDQDEVYEVYLHDPEDPADPRYPVHWGPKGREGPFLVRPVGGRPKDKAWLRSKVRELGAAYEVTLSSRLHEATMVPTP